MFLHVLEFSPPMAGFETFFNTFRLGTAWSKRLKVGERVLLMDQKQHAVFGIAEVISIKTGPLAVMAASHASFNHNQLGKPDPAKSLIEGSTKRYGPHKCTPEKIFSVIYLKRIYGDHQTLPDDHLYDERE